MREYKCGQEWAGTDWLVTSGCCMWVLVGDGVWGGVWTRVPKNDGVCFGAKIWCICGCYNMGVCFGDRRWWLSECQNIGGAKVWSLLGKTNEMKI